MCLEGPEGSITKSGTDPEAQGDVGDPIRPRLCWIHGEMERKKWRGSDGGRNGGMMGEALSMCLQIPIERAFSYLAEHMLSLADV